MHAPRTTIWAIEEHTLAKHEILRKYLEWWLPAVVASNENVTIFDGFAGPGEYKGGEPGSPVIAIDISLRYFPEAIHQNKVTFLFIEQKIKRCKHLCSLISKRIQLTTSLPAIKYSIHKNNFATFVDEWFTTAKQDLTGLTPCFAFIDPFGFAGVPIRAINQLMSNVECEVLITFMYEEINRFISSKDKKHQRRFDELFGTSEWRMIPEPSKSPSQREQEICDLYCTQLKELCNIRYVSMFRMINKKNMTDYFLIFGTNKRESLKKMKDIFWDIDPMDGYNFSDFENQNQLHLFPPEPDYDLLKRILIHQFSKTTVSISDIDEYILTETTFLWSACQDRVLKSMEETSHIRVTSSKLGRKIGDYSEVEYIQFL
jgi:three-Cys-motif partner protein